MFIQLAEHEVEVVLLGKLLQRVGRLHNPKAGRGGVEVAFGRGVDDRGDVSGAVPPLFNALFKEHRKF